MKKRIYSYLMQPFYRYSKDKYIKTTKALLLQSKADVKQRRQKLIEAYNLDIEGSIQPRIDLLKNSRRCVNDWKSSLKAIDDPRVKGRFSYERVRQKIYQELQSQEQPFDLTIEQAKRAYEKRHLEMKQWMEENFTVDEQLDRLREHKYYEGCPVGNYANLYQ